MRIYHFAIIRQKNDTSPIRSTAAPNWSIGPPNNGKNHWVKTT